jgi:hypothetical protein
MNKKAAQIVSNLLEYGVDPDAPRPGGPEDPWRQSSGPLPPFTVKARPGHEDEVIDEIPAEEDEAPVKPAPKPNKHLGRFNITFPPSMESVPSARSLLHELGGHYCTTCRKPTEGSFDPKSKKVVCKHCGNELVYPKSSSLRSREVVHGKSANESLKKACWKGYEAVGTKKKGGRTVPNCVPKKK